MALRSQLIHDADEVLRIIDAISDDELSEGDDNYDFDRTIVDSEVMLLGRQS